MRRVGREAVDTSGRYIYMQDLRKMDKMVPATLPSMPQSNSEVASSLRWEARTQELSCHPDQECATFVVGGIRNGFRIGYEYGVHSYKSCSGNMASARQHPAPIRKYLASEMSEGRIIGPVDVDSIGAKLQISHFGVIPKPHQPGKWRLITDLSSPEGSASMTESPHGCARCHISQWMRPFAGSSSWGGVPYWQNSTSKVRTASYPCTR